VQVLVLVPQTTAISRLRRAGLLKPAPVFRSSSYYKGGENQKNRRPGWGCFLLALARLIAPPSSFFYLFFSFISFHFISLFLLLTALPFRVYSN
jgi:hypothetical protein